jgi:hypothetical protein
MGRPKKYANDAEKQAAYRNRVRRCQEEAEKTTVEAAANRLQDALLLAATCGNVQASLLRASNVTETLLRLAAHFEDDAAHSGAFKYRN